MEFPWQRSALLTCISILGAAWVVSGGTVFSFTKIGATPIVILLIAGDAVSAIAKMPSLLAETGGLPCQRLAAAEGCLWDCQG